jgi:hypothetical protein
MICKSLFRKAIVTVAAGVCAALIGNPLPAHAQQMQVLGASPPVENSAAKVPSSQRLILHGVHLRSRDLKIERSSRPVLDYAAQVLQQEPATTVYVSSEGDSAKVQSQAQAVAQYLQQRGIAADRLVVSNSGMTRPAPAMEMPEAKLPASGAGVIVLNITTPGCVSCS